MEFFEEKLTFTLQFLFLRVDVVRLDTVEVEEVQFRGLLQSDGELAIDLGEVEDIVGLLGGVETVLDDVFFEDNHFLVDALRERTVQLLQLGQELELLCLHFLYMLHPPQDAIYLLYQVLALLDRKHTK